ncbi:hypothetical protein [Desulfotalea psychrophila]|uniref:Uncharacterized protein n=1 Tax=Desulfotalea psychrophila (strain LSv54 / DSM 12343) TaxID=177439 RepID=Q6AMX0_DESPS|nr:hypothetical protein [Desulfotalea psychrophila]CAG36304.1 unknown protein [Desulfotalea psychrophila LSv54]
MTDTPSWQNYTETNKKADVLRYLQETGWQLRKQTFYNHCGDGKLKKNRSGLYSKQAVKKYAETWLVHIGLGSTVGEAEENLAKQKTKKEIDRITTSEQHERFKLDILRGKYIERSKVELELASRAVVLDHGLDYLIKSNVAEMVALVGGMADKTTLLLDFLLKKKDAQLSHYASIDDFTVNLQIESEVESC